MNEPSVAADLDLLHRILSTYLAGRPVRVFLFGSAARGRSCRTSDIDIAVLPLAPLPPGLLAELRGALKEANLLHEVELLDLSEVDPAFRERILREGTEWAVPANV